MRLLAFSRRTAREILRDPLNLAFGIGFPVLLLLLLTAIQANAPVSLFEIGHLTPGIAVFGLSFMTLFSATLLAKDRESALLQRLYTSPLTAAEFILGYALPILPIALAQIAVCYTTALCLGLPFTGRIVSAILILIPAALFFIALGLLCGSVLSQKQVGGVCGALLTNAAALLSGAWFDLSLVGGAFERVANLLPFAHAVQLGRGALEGSAAGMGAHMAWVAAWALLCAVGAVRLFLRQMRRG